MLLKENGDIETESESEDDNALPPLMESDVEEYAVEGEALVTRPATLPEETIQRLTEKISTLKITDKVPEKQGKLLVFKDPFSILKEEKAKAESFVHLQRSGMRFIHMGVIQVRIQILHRQEEGTMTLILFGDNRWQGDRAILATMEIDLTHGIQLVYVIPDTMLTISDFYRNIQISVLARGYENWHNGEANLLITRIMVGRLSNTPNVGFAYYMDNVVDYLASHGARALLGRSYSTRDVLGKNWIIQQPQVDIPMQPTEVHTRNLLDGRISIHFDNYQAATTSSPPKYNQRDEEIQSDEDEIHSQIVAVIHHDQPLFVKRLVPSALLPAKKTNGATGYDLAINQCQDILKQSRTLLTTDIAIQVPEGTYARIAPRSGASLTKGILIGGGIIDADYQGKIKILAFNITNQDIFL
ncbi:hypothetical protein ZIOFF_050776 [Zingiber officinale]|uniref:dUTP diphosphatase n=1 Tax=Zingiber officinale TaxID=94328 RepID=A0A8J5FJG5_ZINOF|nr:hypothetical protein ZIOFF_050776 [Zingiber officinale]